MHGKEADDNVFSRIGLLESTEESIEINGEKLEENKEDVRKLAAKNICLDEVAACTPDALHTPAKSQ